MNLSLLVLLVFKWIQLIHGMQDVGQSSGNDIQSGNVIAGVVNQTQIPSNGIMQSETRNAQSSTVPAHAPISNVLNSNVQSQIIVSQSTSNNLHGVPNNTHPQNIVSQSTSSNLHAVPNNTQSANGTTNGTTNGIIRGHVAMQANEAPDQTQTVQQQQPAIADPAGQVAQDAAAPAAPTEVAEPAEQPIPPASSDTAVVSPPTTPVSEEVVEPNLGIIISRPADATASGNKSFISAMASRYCGVLPGGCKSLTQSIKNQDKLTIGAQVPVFVVASSTSTATVNSPTNAAVNLQGTESNTTASSNSNNKWTAQFMLLVDDKSVLHLTNAPTVLAAKSDSSSTSQSSTNAETVGQAAAATTNTLNTHQPIPLVTVSLVYANGIYSSQPIPWMTADRRLVSTERTLLIRLIQGKLSSMSWLEPSCAVASEQLLVCRAINTPGNQNGKKRVVQKECICRDGICGYEVSANAVMQDMEVVVAWSGTDANGKDLDSWMNLREAFI